MKLRQNIALQTRESKLQAMILKKQAVKNFSCTIKVKTVDFDVLVSPKAAVNDEYLKQEITSAQGRKGTTAYTFADAEKQDSYSLRRLKQQKLS